MLTTELTSSERGHLQTLRDTLARTMRCAPGALPQAQELMDDLNERLVRSAPPQMGPTTTYDRVPTGQFFLWAEDIDPEREAIETRDIYLKVNGGSRMAWLAPPSEFDPVDGHSFGAIVDTEDMSPGDVQEVIWPILDQHKAQVTAEINKRLQRAAAAATREHKEKLALLNVLANGQV